MSVNNPSHKISAIPDVTKNQIMLEVTRKCDEMKYSKHAVNSHGIGDVDQILIECHGN